MIEWTMSVSSVLDYIKMFFCFLCTGVGGYIQCREYTNSPNHQVSLCRQEYRYIYTYRYMPNIRLYVHHGSVIAYIYCHAILLERLVSLLPLEKINIITLAHLHTFTHMKVMNRIYLDCERLWENILKNIILKTSNIAPKRRSKFHKKISRIHVKNQSFYSV